jgi:hypothetical protein
MFNRRLVSAMSAVLLLGGCSALEVMTFKSSDDSFVRKSELVSLAVVGMPGRQTGGRDSQNVQLNIRDPDGSVARACGLSAGAGPRAEFAGAAGLIVLGVGILYDYGVSKLNEYVERKVKEFKHTYSARTNVGQFYLPRSNEDDRITPRTRCIVFQREVKLGNDDAKTTALTLVLQFQPLGNRSYVLTPVYLDLAYAGARTSAEGSAIDLDVAVGIAVVKQQRGSTASVSELVTQQNYSLRKIAIRGKGPALSSYAAKFEPGTVIPAFDGPTAATVVVAVTETGDGADSFGQLKKDSDAYSKVLKDLGLEQLKSLLGAQ